MNGMTLLNGSICTLDGKPFCEIKDIQEVDFPFEDVCDDIAAKLELPKEVIFECNSFNIAQDPWLKKMFGLWSRKKAKPVRKRLLKRLRNRYGWAMSRDFTLTPNKDGTFSCKVDAGVLEVKL